jgi:hypothetical protein
MRRSLLWRPAIGLLLAACAVAPAPPSPPVAVPLVDSPREYQWRPFKWSPGRKLVYRTITVSEALARGQTKTTRQETINTQTATERTAAGMVRVAWMGDATATGLYVLFDEHGRAQDFIVDQSLSMASEERLRDFFRRLQSHVQQFENQPFMLNQPRTMDLTPYLGLELPRTLAESGREAQFTFTGLQRLAGKRVAALRFEISKAFAPPTPLPLPERAGEFLNVDALIIRGDMYFDVDQGYSVVEYLLATIAGEYSAVKGERVTIRITSLKTLDFEQSAGL